jgi:glycosyltransferase involved in cell wall biosynthesis
MHEPRLLHVITSGDRRGGDVFASDLATVLCELGFEQRVAALRPPRSTPIEYPIRVDVLSSGRIDIPALNMNAGVVRALRTITRSWQPDVIQAHGGEPYKYALASSPRRTPPIVYRRIGGAPRWLMRGPRRRVHGQLMRRATRIVAVADAVRAETILLFGVDPRQVVTVPNAVDTHRSRPSMDREEIRKVLDVPDEAIVLLSLGSLSWEKDPLAQLEIALRVMEQHPEVMHIFVGDGPLRPEIERVIEERHLFGRSRVIGPRSDVANILSASDVLLFTSQAGSMEGMPATIIEAGMAGIPAVAYSVAGVPEVIQDGVTGLLAPPGDVDMVTGQVVGLVSNPERRRRLGQGAREAYLRSFDIRVVAPRYAEIYEEVGILR